MKLQRQFPSCRLGRTIEKVSRRGWCWIQRCDRSFLHQSLLGREGHIRDGPSNRSDGWPRCQCQSRGASQWKRRESGGSGGKTTTHSNQPIRKHLPFPPFFFSDNVGDRYLAVTAMMHVIQPIANEWPIKPPFDNRQVLLATSSSQLALTKVGISDPSKIK